MAITPEGPTDPASRYGEAVELLRSGRLGEGMTLLTDIAEAAPEPTLRSKCLYNLGEVLSKVGQEEPAYRLWFQLAHRPPEQRNRFDWLARLRVMGEFDRLGLRRRPPDFPAKLQLEVTNRCNLRCLMCTRNQMRRPEGDMSWETFRKVAAEWREEPATMLCLYFLGEPLLHPELDRMIAELAAPIDRGEGVPPAVFGIQTNGMLLTGDRARSLIAAGLRNITVSLDGLEGDLERVRRGASYPTIERNLLDLLDLRREMGAADLQIDITKLCEDPRADEVRRFRARWEGKVDHILISGLTRIEGNSYLGSDGTIKPMAARPAGPFRYCGQGQRIIIHWTGDYGFCQGDINGEIRLGNVRERSIRQVWQGPEMTALRRRIAAADLADLPVCRACPHGIGPADPTPRTPPQTPKSGLISGC